MAITSNKDKDYDQSHEDDQTAWDIFKGAPRMDEGDLPLERDRTPVRSIELIDQESIPDRSPRQSRRGPETVLRT
ncbi:MAG: hypothetical protein ACRDG4_02150 [Chloroflexota bacterium]